MLRGTAPSTYFDPGEDLAYGQVMPAFKLFTSLQHIYGIQYIGCVVLEYPSVHRYLPGCTARALITAMVDGCAHVIRHAAVMLRYGSSYLTKMFDGVLHGSSCESASFLLLNDRK